MIDWIRQWFRGEDQPAWKSVNHRAKTPTVLQMEAVECGAASLAMILGYHGRFEPLEQLRIECGVSRDGSKASNILKAARSYGLEAKGYKKPLDQLPELEFPVILFWNFNHFVVLEGFKNGTVYLNDPASGPREITWEELDDSFTGVVLTFKPTDEFEKGGSRKSMLKGLARRLSHSRLALTFIVLAGLFLVIPGLIIPIFSKIFVDQFLVGGLESWLKPLLLAMGVTALIHAGLHWLQQRFLLRLETKLSLTEASRYLWHVLRLPVQFFSQRYPGDVASRLQINDEVANVISERLMSTLISCATIIFYAFVMFYYDVVLTLVGIAMVSLNVAALQFVSQKKINSSRRLQKEQGKLQGVAMNGLRSIETLKSTGGESDFFSTWSGHFAKVINYQQQLGGMTRVLNVVPPMLQSVTIALIRGIGGFRVMGGHLTMGMLVAFQSLMMSFMAPVQDLVQMGSKLQDLKGNMEKLDDVYEYEIDPIFRDPAGDRTDQEESESEKLSGHVTVENLEFGYNPLDAPLIEQFGMELKPGMRIALVGPSGCGKSTIAKLIAGLFKPWDGKILFDGKSRTDYSRDQITNSLSVVDQDISMFEGTVLENLTLWDDTIPEENVIRAAKDARIHDEIASRTGGYKSTIAESGGNFSGGQRQRLEIARALVCNPTFLVMDEATSALDPTTEQEVDDNIRRRGCTCLIVAHRLSTIRDCDEIIVLKDGVIQQRGPHEQLIETEGLYAELIHAGESGEEGENE